MEQQIANVTVVNNNTMAPVYAVSRRRQSIKIHILLAFISYGIGNYFYAKKINNWNRERGL